MPTIEQRILIPASPARVWELLGDMEKHPRWRQDGARVASLSAARHEAGARWRYTPAQGPDVVIEISAYLPRAGLEYLVIDGLPLENGRGRFRLQETSEGTAIYWSFEYSRRGFRPGKGKQQRALAAQMEASLRRLWQLLREDPGGIPLSRAAVQEAPDADARAQYIPRHGNRLPPDDLLAAAAATPPALDDTQAQPALQAADLADEAPPADAEATPAAGMPALDITALEEETPDTPLRTPSLFDLEEDSETDERSIFDIFGIQRPDGEDSGEILPDTSEMRAANAPNTEESALVKLRSTRREGARSRARRRQISGRR